MQQTGKIPLPRSPHFLEHNRINLRDDRQQREPDTVHLKFLRSCVKAVRSSFIFSATEIASQHEDAAVEDELGR